VIRYFKLSHDTSSEYWRWDGLEMWCSCNGDGDEDESHFTSCAELLECHGIIEVDEFGRPLPPSAEDVASAKGDHAQSIESDMGGVL